MVYVIAKSGKPLMPCKSAKARKLLRDGKAKVKRRNPFTIKLLFDCEEKTQEVFGGSKTVLITFKLYGSRSKKHKEVMEALHNVVGP